MHIFLLLHNFKNYYSISKVTFCNVVDAGRALDVRDSRCASCLPAAINWSEVWRRVCGVTTGQVGTCQFPPAQYASRYDGRILAAEGSAPRTQDDQQLLECRANPSSTTQRSSHLLL